MPLYHILILSLIQGLTEFLPVSSSGHLVLTHYLMGEGSIDLCWEQNRSHGCSRACWNAFIRSHIFS